MYSHCQSTILQDKLTALQADYDRIQRTSQDQIAARDGTLTIDILMTGVIFSCTVYRGDKDLL